MDKQNVVSPYNGIVLSLKMEGNSDTCYNAHELEGSMLGEISQSLRTNSIGLR